MNTDPIIPIKRALLSVSDKTDLIPFARALESRGIEIISTGGTAKAIREAGIKVTAIGDVTGFPEIMDGRVKTLHPRVHGALLARRDVASHVDAMNEHGIDPIDLVCVNLYPFEQTVARSDEVTHDEIIEQIDIGGPSMIRSAAKNHEFVTIVTSPSQYDKIVNELAAHDGGTSLRLRRTFAAAAFSRTAEYDATISAWMNRASVDRTPDQLRINYTKVLDLRYGENPHQDAALYRDPTSLGPTVVNAKRLHGKEMSYNNYNDGAAALAMVREFSQAGVCVVKHTNPCGAAMADTLVEAFDKAYAGDPMAAYGGILACNRELDATTATHIAEGQKFFEVIIAPSFADDALPILQNRWKNVRILAVGTHKTSPYAKLEYRSLPGGMLLQHQDLRSAETSQWKHAAGPEPTPIQLEDAGITWLVCKHLKSNAIAIGGDQRLYGAGAGQMDRVASAKMAIDKAGTNATGAIACSDAFFPFPDGPQLLIDAGIKMIVHPGGSKRDADTFAICDEHDVTCMLTGNRHFRH